MTLAPAGRFPAEIAERVRSSQPLPIADATGALVAADSAFEQRDRVVEVFRGALRTLSAFVLAARVQFGKGPGAQSSQIPELLRSLRSRGLTDGQWFAIVREMLRPWAQAPASHPLADLVTLVHGKKSELPKLVDELLAMRKSETVAHGASGTKAALGEILARRIPQLAKVLVALEPLWAKARLVVPLAKPEADDEPQPAWLLMGDTPARGRWRRVDLAAGVRAAPGEALLVDPKGKPLLALHPLVLVRRPSPEAIEEVFVLDGGSKKGAVFVALPSMAEHRETEAWTHLSRALSDEEAPPENPEIGVTTRPFRGLSSFGPEHTALFFGREEQTEDLANRIRRQPFVTVTGPSGSGKTSLLRAGALPTLTDHAVALLRPGAKPLEALTTKLAEATGHFLPETELLRKLRADPSSLGATLALWSRESSASGPASAPASTTSTGSVFRIAGEPTAPKIVIIVDQAEEMLTLCHDEAERDAFAKALVSAGTSPDAPSRVVVSVREDFFGRLATVGPLRGVYSRTVEVVTTPDRDALARTLYLPAKQFAYAFEDEQLITTMVDTVASEPAALALLQFCADRLWEVRDRTWKRLTWDAYRALGGVEGALAAHADRVLAEMSPAQQKACRALLLRLVTAERTRAVVTRRELLESAPSPDEASAVLDRLIAGRLLTVGESEEGGEVRVEIVHEALIRHWGALAGWLEEDVEGQRLTHALRQAAREWENRKRPRGLVWRGEALDDLKRWRKRATDRLTAEEAAFVQASEAEERRGSRIRRGLGAAAFAATAAFAAFMFFQWRASDAQRAEAERSAASARNATRVAAARMRQADPTTVLALLREVESGLSVGAEASLSSSLLPRGWAELARWARGAGVAEAVLFHTADVNRAAWSPDGKRIASASSDKTVRVWNADGSGTPLVFRGHEDGVWAVAWSPDGKRIASASPDKTVRVWNADGSGTPLVLEGHEDPVWSTAWSPDGKHIASASQDLTVRVWNADGSGTPLALQGHEGSVYTAAWSPDGQHIVSASHDKTVRVWNADGSGTPLVLRGHEDRVWTAVFSPDSQRIVSASQDRTVRVWNADGSGQPLVLRGHESHVMSAAFSPDGRRIVSASFDQTVRVWPADGSGPPLILQGHGDFAITAAFSPDGRRIVSAAHDKTVRVWDLGGSGTPLVLRGHEDNVYSAELSPDGQRIASAAHDKTVRIWNADGSGTPLVLRGHENRIQLVAWSPDGKRVVSASQDKTMRVWNTDGSGAPLVLRGHAEQVTSAAWSPDGQRIVSASFDKTVRVWNADGSGTPLVLRGHENRVFFAAWSPDGKRVVSASLDKTVRVWNADGSGTPLVLRGHEERVWAAVFSPDGRRIASAAHDRTIRVWNADGSGQPLILRGHEKSAMVRSTRPWSPDGRRIVSSSNDGTVRVWNADGTGEPLVLRASDVPVNSASWSPDGRQIVAASDDKTVIVWSDLTPLSGPDDPSLWTPTSYCLPLADRERLLGFSAAQNQADLERCERRVRETLQGAGAGAPER